MYHGNDEMHCGHHEEHGYGHPWHGTRPHFYQRQDCFSHHHHGRGIRRFFTRDEKIAHLEEYLKQLQSEAQGVEEYLAEIKKSQ